jgi:hypothetical protein
MKAAGAAFVLLSLAAQAEPALAQATPQELERTRNAAVLCFMNVAKRMDDQRSDASTIALAIESMCAAEWDAHMEALTRGMSAPTLRAVSQFAASREIQLATQAVLSERALHRKSGN